VVDLLAIPRFRNIEGGVGHIVFTDHHFRMQNAIQILLHIGARFAWIRMVVDVVGGIAVAQEFLREDGIHAHEIDVGVLGQPDSPTFQRDVRIAARVVVGVPEVCNALLFQVPSGATRDQPAISFDEILKSLIDELLSPFHGIKVMDVWKRYAFPVRVRLKVASHVGWHGHVLEQMEYVAQGPNGPSEPGFSDQFLWTRLWPFSGRNGVGFADFRE